MGDREFTPEERELQRRFMELTRARDPQPPSVADGLQPGFHDLPVDVYRDDPCPVPALSASIAHLIVSRSELHAWTRHPRLGGHSTPPSKDMDRGTLIHALLLGKGAEIVVVDAKDWRTDKAQAAREDARKAGKLACLPREKLRADEIVMAIRPQLEARGIRLTGQSELTIIWREKADCGTEVWCRGMLDHVLLDTGEIFDVKTSGKSVAPDTHSRKVESEGADIQAAAYMSGLEVLRPELAGRATYRWVFCETDDPPYAVCDNYPRGSMRQLGLMRWREAVNRWARAMNTGLWPGYPLDAGGVEASHWRLEGAMYRAMNEDEGETAA